ncbi:MAG TPA: hypothetical protein PLC34_14020 [Burkholderiaceae bacterium]|nr:hypothetical protein [Burkholderiaceae bacterium]
MKPLIAFAAIVAAPFFLYALRHSRLITAQVSDLLIAGYITACGLIFLLLCVVVFLQSGHLLNPGKTAPLALPPDAGVFWKLVAIGVSGFLGGSMLWVGVPPIWKHFVSGRGIGASQ